MPGERLRPIGILPEDEILPRSRTSSERDRRLRGHFRRRGRGSILSVRCEWKLARRSERPGLPISGRRRVELPLVGRWSYILDFAYKRHLLSQFERAFPKVDASL